MKLPTKPSNDILGPDGRYEAPLVLKGLPKPKKQFHAGTKAPQHSKRKGRVRGR